MVCDDKADGFEVYVEPEKKGRGNGDGVEHAKFVGSEQARDFVSDRRCKHDLGDGADNRVQ